MYMKGVTSKVYIIHNLYIFKIQFRSKVKCTELQLQLKYTSKPQLQLKYTLIFNIL